VVAAQSDTNLTQKLREHPSSGVNDNSSF